MKVTNQCSVFDENIYIFNCMYLPDQIYINIEAYIVLMA